MTGMQINPGTPQGYFKDQEVDIARIIPTLGVKNYFEVDPFDVNGTYKTLQNAFLLPGIKVILARGECVIQSMRRDRPRASLRVIEENCYLCRLCILRTGCAALIEGEKPVFIDTARCTGCGICVQTCNLGALVVEAIAERSQ